MSEWQKSGQTNASILVVPAPSVLNPAGSDGGNASQRCQVTLAPASHEHPAPLASASWWLRTCHPNELGYVVSPAPASQRHPVSSAFTSQGTPHGTQSPCVRKRMIPGPTRLREPEVLFAVPASSAPRAMVPSHFPRPRARGSRSLSLESGGTQSLPRSQARNTIPENSTCTSSLPRDDQACFRNTRVVHLNVLLRRH